MEEFKPKRKNNNYSGTDKAGAPRRAPRQNHQNKPPQENSTPANKPRRRPARPAAAEAAQAPAQSVPAPRPRRPRNTPQGEGQAPHQQRRGRKPQKNNNAPHYEMTPAIPMHICPLGGLGEVGKNITLYECQGDMILVDCGLVFPDADMFGVDLVIPDFTYVLENKDRIKGLFITHGHEDHIGSLPYLLKKFNVPIYAARLTIGLIKNKLEEHGLASSAVFHEIRPRQKVKLGCFTVEPIHVNHSIPDALAFAIECPAGVVIHTGDFKVDYTPLSGDAVTDLSTIAEYGRKGVLALLSDSTNAERPGFTESERKVGESFETLFRRAGNNRIIVATFSSNIHRVQQIMNVAESLGRKVALVGRSLENVVNISAELGYLNIPEGIVIDINMINRYPADKLVIITTGSQGEPMSALTRMAFSDHRKVEIHPNDYVIISATPIPGNEKTVSRVVNELMKLGADVVYERMYDVHVSGHACQEELKMIMGIVKPKYFIPVHGELKHLRKHAGLALNVGIPKENILIADNGRVAEISKKALKCTSTVPAGRVFVDGYGVGDVGSVVLRDRKHLAQDGLVIVAVCIDRENGEIVSGPDVVTRGFVYVKESEELINAAREVAVRAIEAQTDGGYFDWNSIKASLRDEISHLMYERTKRSPMILPVIMEV